MLRSLGMGQKRAPSFSGKRGQAACASGGRMPASVQVCLLLVVKVRTDFALHLIVQCALTPLHF